MIPPPRRRLLRGRALQGCFLKGGRGKGGPRGYRPPRGTATPPSQPRARETPPLYPGPAVVLQEPVDNKKSKTHARVETQAT